MKKIANLWVKDSSKVALTCYNGRDEETQKVVIRNGQVWVYNVQEVEMYDWAQCREFCCDAIKGISERFILKEKMALWEFEIKVKVLIDFGLYDIEEIILF